MLRNKIILTNKINHILKVLVTKYSIFNIEINNYRASIIVNVDIVTWEVMEPLVEVLKKKKTNWKLYNLQNQFKIEIW